MYIYKNGNKNCVNYVSSRMRFIIVSLTVHRDVAISAFWANLLGSQKKQLL